VKLTDDNPRSFTTPWSVHAWSKRKGGSSREKREGCMSCHLSERDRVEDLSLHIPARLDVVLSILLARSLFVLTPLVPIFVILRHPSVRINKRTTAMRFSLGVAAAGLLLASLTGTSSFSYFNSQPHHNVQNHDVHQDTSDFDRRQQQNPSIFQSDEEALASKRRNFFSKVTGATAAATALSAVPSVPPAYAVTDAPTRIELVVETDYLIRVLNYFDGDMRKVLGAIVRSPLTSVEIEPPQAKFNLFGEETIISPKDAILRALYSKNTPDINEQQMSWLKVDSPNPWIEFLTKKRYELDIPFLYMKEGEKRGSIKKIVVKPATTLSLSNIEAAIGVATLSYPVAYAFYNYESWQEEQEKAAKKKMMAAKKKAKTKAASKGTVTKGGATAAAAVANDVKASKKPAMKGEVAKPSKVEKEKAFPKKPVSVSEREEATVAPNAMTEALNQIFGTTPGITAVLSDAEPSTETRPPKFQKQQAELIDHLEFVNEMSDKDVTVKVEAATAKKDELPSPPPEIKQSMFAASQKTKGGDGGMSAYDAQMKALMNQK
jgi:hypothetical protein